MLANVYHYENKLFYLFIKIIFQEWVMLQLYDWSIKFSKYFSCVDKQCPWRKLSS